MAAIEKTAGTRLDCSPILAVMGRSFFKGGGPAGFLGERPHLGPFGLKVCRRAIQSRCNCSSCCLLTPPPHPPELENQNSTFC